MAQNGKMKLEVQDKEPAKVEMAANQEALNWNMFPVQQGRCPALRVFPAHWE